MDKIINLECQKTFFRCLEKMMILWIEQILPRRVKRCLHTLLSLLHGVYFAMGDRLPARGIDIGAGMKWRHFRWKSFDQLYGFIFDSTTSLPLADNSLSYAFSSMLLEHVDDDTATQVCKEVFRCLKRGKGGV